MRTHDAPTPRLRVVTGALATGALATDARAPGGADRVPASGRGGRRTHALSLRARVGAALAMLVFVVAGLVGTLTGESSVNQLRDRIGQSLANDAARMAERLDSEMAARARELALVADLDLLRELARLGGDEFVLASRARRGAAAIRRRARSLAGRWLRSPRHATCAGRSCVSDSAWAAPAGRTMRPTRRQATPVRTTPAWMECWERADAALYVVKRSGKGRILIHGEVEPAAAT